MMIAIMSPIWRRGSRWWVQIAHGIIVMDKFTNIEQYDLKVDQRDTH